MPDRLAKLSTPGSSNDNTSERPLDVYRISMNDWDDTVVDTEDHEQLTLSQVDEHGGTHTVILSRDMLDILKDPLIQWLTANP